MTKMCKTILLIGGGPSTKLLVDYGFENIPVDTFGMGACYRYYERINWWPTYYGWLDVKTVTSHEQALKRVVEDSEIPVERYYFSRRISDSPKLTVVPHQSTGSGLFRIARGLGYTKILLIGIECKYVERIKESRPLTKQESDVFRARVGPPISELDSYFGKNLLTITETPEHNPNYFFHGYQQEGDVYSKPNVAISHAVSWRRLRKQYWQHLTIEVVNCSPSSKLKFKRRGLVKELDKCRSCQMQMES